MTYRIANSYNYWMYMVQHDTLPIKTKLATRFAAMRLANSIENKIESQCGKQKNLARQSCAG